MPTQLEEGVETWVLGFLDAPPKSSLLRECRQTEVIHERGPKLPVSVKAEMPLSRTRALGTLGTTDQDSNLETAFLT